MENTYSWCPNCQRRIADVLFTSGKCRGCNDDERRSQPPAEVTFTDEEYEEMGNM